MSNINKAIDRIVGVRFKSLKGNRVYAVKVPNVTDVVNICNRCYFTFNDRDCLNSLCEKKERSDNNDVYFKIDR